VTPPETEKGFGTGLRAQLQRIQNGEGEQGAPPPPEQETVPPAAVSTAVDVIVQANVPELETMRGELQAALEREHVVGEVDCPALVDLVAAAVVEIDGDQRLRSSV